jgi:2,4'-dihydroxyacetophenone dioxygenase
MATAMENINTFNFDDQHIAWEPFAGIDHLELALLDFDEDRQVIDMIVRFEPNEKVTIHNHIAQTNMFVIQGELRMYETDGKLKEARQAGRYYRGKRDDCHSEGGGPDGAIVFYSVRGHGTEDLFHLMDDQENILATVGMPEVREMWNARS